MVEASVNTETTKKEIKSVPTKDWERVVFPDIPIVKNPTVVRQSLPIPAGRHYCTSVGVSYKGTSKKGNELLFLVIHSDEHGEQSLMVTKEELLKFGEDKTPVWVTTSEPRDGYTTVVKIEAV